MALPVQTVRYYAYVWVALAKLQYDHLGRISFHTNEIQAEMRKLWPDMPTRPIFRQLLYQHMVASREPNGMPLRLIHKMADGSNRLYQAGDPVHPSRIHGKSVPDAVPDGFQYLLDWYRETRGTSQAADPPVWEAANPNQSGPGSGDRILALWKKGERVWIELGGADAFVYRIRAAWDGAERS